MVVAALKKIRKRLKMWFISYKMLNFAVVFDI